MKVSLVKVELALSETSSDSIFDTDLYLCLESIDKREVANHLGKDPVLGRHPE